MNDVPTLEFSIIRDRIEELTTFTKNKLERDWPIDWKEYGFGDALPIVSLHVAVANNTYRTIRFFCADSPEDIKRKPEYSLSASPLIRSMLDILCNLVFMFDNLAENSKWYIQSGICELCNMHLRFNERYAGTSESWDGWLTYIHNFILDAMEKTQLEDDDILKPKYWPILNQMIGGHHNLSEERKDYLRFLQDWFYRELSQKTHMSWPGLVLECKDLINRDDESREQYFEQRKSNAYFDAITLYMAVLSEIEIELKFGAMDRLQYVWTLIRETWPRASDIYEHRYNAKFS